ncbi:unnamed protein product [Ostreobium quekettii]|uniref:Uncharacterized protein n=1 Tax=Ostreobium quekettii TaxID=121088 RepID=A0A8S1IZQ7_9CHLO|nr:unnamed protein product [Ostreobium quekettii]|eukprot:evm.model.scf_199.6 EVM.evm.TU.scf_199.6   scf_199:33899-36300(+)
MGPLVLLSGLRMALAPGRRPRLGRASLSGIWGAIEAGRPQSDAGVPPRGEGLRGPRRLARGEVSLTVLRCGASSGAVEEPQRKGLLGRMTSRDCVVLMAMGDAHQRTGDSVRALAGEGPDRSEEGPSVGPMADPATAEALGEAPSARPVMLILVGIQGSGKSTFSKDLVEKGMSTWMRVNQDSVRSGGRGTREQCRRAAKECLQRGINCIVDRMNLTADQRQTFIQLALELGCEVHSVCLNLHPRLCATRVGQRENHEGGVEGRMGRRLVYAAYSNLFQSGPPSTSEGIRSVSICNSPKDAQNALLLWRSFSGKLQNVEEADGFGAVGKMTRWGIRYSRPLGSLKASLGQTKSRVKWSAGVGKHSSPTGGNQEISPPAVMDVVPGRRKPTKCHRVDRSPMQLRGKKGGAAASGLQILEMGDTAHLAESILAHS